MVLPSKNSITYINDVHNEKASAYYTAHKVRVPKKDTPYTIREVLLVRDEYTLLLNEISNKPVGDQEPSFHYSRFSDCGPDGVLDWETVHAIYKQQLLDKAAKESKLF